MWHKSHCCGVEVGAHAVRNYNLQGQKKKQEGNLYFSFRFEDSPWCWRAASGSPLSFTPRCALFAILKPRNRKIEQLPGLFGLCWRYGPRARALGASQLRGQGRVFCAAYIVGMSTIQFKLIPQKPPGVLQHRPL